LEKNGIFLELGVRILGYFSSKGGSEDFMADTSKKYSISIQKPNTISFLSSTAMSEILLLILLVSVPLVLFVGM